MPDPNLIATIVKNIREEIRVGIGEYNGHRFADVRIFVDAPADRAPLGRVPTKKGVAVPIAALPEVIRALQKAHAIEIQRQRVAANQDAPAPKTRKTAR